MPEGWTSIPLREISTKVGSGATPRGGREVYETTGTPFIRSMNVHFRGFNRNGLVFINDKQAQELKSVEVKTDDVLLNITGASIGRVTLAPEEMDGARVNQHVSIIRLSDGINPSFVRYFLSSPTQQDMIANAESGMTRQALTKEKIENFDIPLPPAREQDRIAQKLDRLLTRVDACRERLDRVPLILKRFRQSVLTAATSGDLAKNMANTDNVEEFWNEVTLEDIADIIDAHPSHRTPPEVEGGVPYIGIGDIDEKGLINFQSSKKVSWEIYSEHQQRYQINDGDFIFGKIGTLGRPTKLPTNLKYTISANVLLIKPKIASIYPDYLRFVLGSPDFI